MLKKIILLFFVLTLLGGCKKYPEDPATIHLRTAKQRLTQRSFITDKAKSNNTGIDYSGSPGNDYVHFLKNGDFHGDHSILFQFNGKWEFEDKKNNIHIYNETKSFSFQIIRLDAHYLSLKNDTIRCDYHNTRP